MTAIERFKKDPGLRAELTLLLNSEVMELAIEAAMRLQPSDPFLKFQLAGEDLISRLAIDQAERTGAENFLKALRRLSKLDEKPINEKAEDEAVHWADYSPPNLDY